MGKKVIVVEGGHKHKGYDLQTKEVSLNKEFVEDFAEYADLKRQMDNCVRARGTDYGIAVDADDLAVEWWALNDKAVKTEVKHLGSPHRKEKVKG